MTDHSPAHAERAAIVAPCCEAEMGSYQGYVELVPPPHLRRDDGRGICVDACLALEVSRLWALGITTTGCCCGHSVAPAFIGVVGSDLIPMLKLGYVRAQGLGDPLSLSPLTGCAARASLHDTVHTNSNTKDTDDGE